MLHLYTRTQTLASKIERGRIDASKRLDITQNHTYTHNSRIWRRRKRNKINRSCSGSIPVRLVIDPTAYVMTLLTVKFVSIQIRIRVYQGYGTPNWAKNRENNPTWTREKWANNSKKIVQEQILSYRRNFFLTFFSVSLFFPFCSTSKIFCLHFSCPFSQFGVS